MLPTILRASGYWFHVCQRDASAATHALDPPHVHVRRGGAEAVVWLGSGRVGQAVGFEPAELKRIRGIARDHRTLLLRAWDDHRRRTAH